MKNTAKKPRPKIPEVIRDHIWGYKSEISPRKVKKYAAWVQSRLKEETLVLYRGDTVADLKQLQLKKQKGISFSTSKRDTVTTKKTTYRKKWDF